MVLDSDPVEGQFSGSVNICYRSIIYGSVTPNNGIGSRRPVNSVADPDPRLGAFLTPGSGIRDGRKSSSGSGIRDIRDEQPGSYFLELRNHFFAFFGVKILQFFDENPGSRMETVRIRDGKKSDPG